MIRLVVNVAGFYAGWFACVLGAGDGRPLLGPLVTVVVLAVHLALHPSRRREAAVIALIGVSGAAIDCVLLASGVFRFDGSTAVTPVFVLWILALWANLAATLDGCLRWMARFPWLAAGLGAIGGPATYWAGVELGAIEFHDNPWLSVIVLAVEWGVLMPLVLWLSARWHAGGVGVSLDEVAS